MRADEARQLLINKDAKPKISEIEKALKKAVQNGERVVTASVSNTVSAHHIAAHFEKLGYETIVGVMHHDGKEYATIVVKIGHS